MRSYICQIDDLGELIKNMRRLAEGTQGTFRYKDKDKEGVILKLKEYTRIKWYYYCDKAEGNTIRLYDSEFHKDFSKLYEEHKGYVILRGRDLGTPDGTLKQKFRDLFESIEKPPPGINANHREACLSYFEERNKKERKPNKSYEVLKGKVRDRKTSFMKFVEMLEKTTSWLDSPASTRFHLNKEQGLLLHSIGVAENLLRFRDFLAPEISPEISDESCVIVGLFHDVGKVGMPGKPLYIKNDNRWEIENRNITYKVNPEVVQMSPAARSLYLVSQYIRLSEAEAQAILYHDGQYIEDNRTIAHREEPLTLLTHWADYWTAHIFEEGREFRSETE